MTDNNKHLSSRIGTLLVTKSQSTFLHELFGWLLDPTHFPEPAQSRGRSKTAKKCRAYGLLMKRATKFRVLFPEDKDQLRRICSAFELMLGKMKENLGLVSYDAKDHSNSWYVRKGPRPAVAPRLLLAACIAKVLWPNRSPYDSVVKQLKSKHHHMEKVAVERQVRRLLADPRKHVICRGGGDDNDLMLLFRHEVLDFKSWKEDQRSTTAGMTTEEFDAQFQPYLDRIHPTTEQLELLRLLLDNFNMTGKHKDKLSTAHSGMNPARASIEE